MVAVQSNHQPKSSIQHAYSLLAGAALGGLVLPLALGNNLPHWAKTALYSAAALSAGTVGVLSKSGYLTAEQQEEKQRRNLHRTVEKLRLAHETAVKDIELQAAQALEIIELLSGLPAPVRDQMLIDLEMGYAIELFQPPAPPPAPRQGEPPTLLAAIAEGGDVDADFKELVSWYAKAAYQSMIFAGRSGEAKTGAVHFALWSWVMTAESGKVPIIYVYDPHYGMSSDPDFESSWLGIPELESVPKTVRTGVFCPTRAEDFLLWLDTVYNLYVHRQQNKIDLKSGAAPVVYVVDEMTQVLKMMDSKQADRATKRLIELATGARKFGIYGWHVLHDLAEKNTGVPRTLFTNCGFVIGARLIQDSQTRQNCPSTFSDHTVEYATIRRAQTPDGIPAGYACTFAVPDSFLPPSPLTNKQMILPWQEMTEQGAADPKSEDEVDTDPYEAWDDQFEDVAGHQPEHDPNWDETQGQPPAPSASIPKSTQARINQQNEQSRQQLVKTIAEWIHELGRMPTDSEFTRTLTKLLGVEPSANVINGVKYLLGTQYGLSFD